MWEYKRHSEYLVFFYYTFITSLTSREFHNLTLLRRLTHRRNRAFDLFGSKFHSHELCVGTLWDNFWHGKLGTGLLDSTVLHCEVLRWLRCRNLTRNGMRTRCHGGSLQATVRRDKSTEELNGRWKRKCVTPGRSSNNLYLRCGDVLIKRKFTKVPPNHVRRGIDHIQTSFELWRELLASVCKVFLPQSFV